MNGFGERLKKLRKDCDVTQSQLAGVIGVVPSAIGKYERVPASYPSIDALIKIADYFHVSIDYLLRGVNTAPDDPDGLDAVQPFVRPNKGGVVFDCGNHPKLLTPEATELLHIYEKLDGRNRLKLLNYVVSLEESTTSDEFSGSKGHVSRL